MTFLSIESPQIWLPLRKLYKKIYTSNWGNSFSVLLIFAIIYFNQFLHTTVWLNYSCQHQIVETSGLYQSLVHFLRMRCEFWRHMAVFAANISKGFGSTFQLMRFIQLFCDVKFRITFAFAESVNRDLHIIVITATVKI